MHTKKFVEDAISGGWSDYIGEIIKKEPSLLQRYVKDALLDPLAWQAVEKTREWKAMEYWDRDGFDGYYVMMHRFLDHLIEGKSIEEALSEIK